MSKTYTFHIDAYSPQTIPMARLALYMQNLALLLGHENAVHFKGLKAGSTQVVTIVDHEDVPKVETQLTRIRRGEGGAEANRAQSELDRLLADDNATGFLFEGDDSSTKIIGFPGAARPKPTTYGPFNQEGSLDGILISVGGADQTVHLQLQNGDVKYTGIDTNRETARQLARHMYEPVRIFGTGRWFRDEDGNWLLRKFRVESYTVLEPQDLKEAIDQMRSVEGSGWKAMDDPLSTLRALRDVDNGPH